MRIAIVTIAILLSSNLMAQRIARSSIGSIGSTYRGGVSILAGSPVSTSILRSSNTQDGMIIQTKPFIQLVLNSNKRPVELVIYPNPTSDVVYVETHEMIDAINLIDVSGRLCHTSNQPKLSLGHLVNGIYTVEVTLQNKITCTQKLIIHK